MTDLRCSVQNCAHNENNKCCCHSIDVGGRDAVEAENTCCEAYVDAKDYSSKNATCSPNCKIEIRCDARNCEYNHAMNCTAEHIDVKISKDTVHGETECATFKVR